MQRLALTLVALAFLAGCYAQNIVKGPPTAKMCDDTAIAPSFVKYGDAHLSAKPVQNIRENKKWRIKLQADNSYSDAIVTITGKTADANWINKSGKASDSTELIICVPDGLTVGKEFYYSVSVQGVGFIDPRAKVVN